MHDDSEDEYFLGPDDTEDDTEDDDPSHDRRTRRGALIGLAVVIVLVTVSITLTSLLVDTTPGPPASPRAAAQQWGDALVHTDATRQRRLECAMGSQRGSVLRRVLIAPRAAHAGPATQQAAQRWSVPLSFDSADGTSEGEVPVTVVQESGRYLIC